MFIVGHCYITRASGIAPEEIVLDHGLGYMMSPDFTNSHDWAYMEAWHAEGDEARLVRAHVVADWYVHFGPTRSPRPRKEGWAYLRMKYAAAFYNEFFGRATAEGLRPVDAPHVPRQVFSHSMTEYAIDTYLSAEHTIRSKFDVMRHALGSLDLTWARSLITRLNARCDPPGIQALEASVKSYADRALMATCPEAFAFYGAAFKFGLSLSPESAEFVATFQQRLLKELDKDEIIWICARMAEAVRDVDR